MKGFVHEMHLRMFMILAMTVGFLLWISGSVEAHANDQRSAKRTESSTEQTNVKQMMSTNGQYSDGWFPVRWSDSDHTFYYIAQNKMYMVCLQETGDLMIYEMNESLQAKKIKTVRLGKYDKWGGFYHGTDNRFYVVIGFDNPKESKTKTVIKVIQYNKNWKRQKICRIKGNASNYFPGIYEPFRAGNCRMDMKGNILYLHTARDMFQSDDGIRHQSNINFEINVKNMTYQTTKDNYVSHSFNQYVKFKDQSLIQVDHGDAYPRSVNLTITENFRENDQKKYSIEIFKLKGKIGENYTGTTVGGMETGENYVLTCGTSVPHNYQVKGVRGYSEELKRNVYLTVTSLKTKKNKVLWLTKYHPKKSEIEVGECRMVKLTRKYFAILFNTTKDQKTIMNYLVVNEKGKTIYSKQYSNINFDADSQPILYKGYIYWTSTRTSGTTSYKVPALYREKS